MYQRLKIWIENINKKPSEIADLIGVNRATISHILSGRNKPSIDFLQKLLNTYPNLNANWLISGLGSMYQNKEKNQITRKQSKIVNKVVIFYDDNSFDELDKN